jgi:hypothetical protein
MLSTSFKCKDVQHTINAYIKCQDVQNTMSVYIKCQDVQNTINEYIKYQEVQTYNNSLWGAFFSWGKGGLRVEGYKEGGYVESRWTLKKWFLSLLWKLVSDSAVKLHWLFVVQSETICFSRPRILMGWTLKQEKGYPLYSKLSPTNAITFIILADLLHQHIPWPCVCLYFALLIRTWSILKTGCNCVSFRDRNSVLQPPSFSPHSLDSFLPPWHFLFKLSYPPSLTRLLLPVSRLHLRTSVLALPRGRCICPVGTAAEHCVWVLMA